jgi:hypothetical protein
MTTTYSMTMPDNICDEPKLVTIDELVRQCEIRLALLKDMQADGVKLDARRPGNFAIFTTEDPVIAEKFGMERRVRLEDLCG